MRLLLRIKELVPSTQFCYRVEHLDIVIWVKLLRAISQLGTLVGSASWRFLRGVSSIHSHYYL
jgi:hypothetical protein